MARTRRGYLITNFGKSITTIVTAEADSVTQWIDRVNARGNRVPRLVGFELEFDYNAFRFGTVQFYYENECIVFQLLDTTQCPPSLDQFLGDPNNIFVGTHTRSKIDLFRVQCPFGAVVRCKDLGENLAFLGERKQGLLASIEIGVVETNWVRLADQLSPNQAHYATLDAFLNLHILNLLWPDLVD